ncbi:MAG: type I methionyl aminopeptidase [Nitrospinota bacterium]|nr:type I methionyl aminopeptidase [Nitrospinota bacterium]
MAIVLRSATEIEKLRDSNRVVLLAMDAVSSKISPGVSTLELDVIAESVLLENGALPAFKGYRGFKHTICASINEQVVHGVPSVRKLLDGDIVSIDIGANLNGYFGDHAVTFEVGSASNEAKRLLCCCHESLMLGIKEAVPGNRLHDISSVIQVNAEKNGYSVVRNFVGHGVGTQLHEEPQVPNFGIPDTGPELKVGMVLAIEPMLNQGTEKVKVLEDKWTVITEDLKLSSHFEHSIAITERGPDILSVIDA